VQIDKWVLVGYVKAGYPERDVKVYAHVKYDGQRLSLTGVEGPKANGDCVGASGQISLDDVVPMDSGVDVSKLREVWKRWHLNDMRAGSPYQEAWLREHPIDPAEYAYPKSHYVVASEKLRAAKLNPDPFSSGYEYGHGWQFEEVPGTVIEFLDSLPATDAPKGWR
jgi:hypothetical protein